MSKSENHRYLVESTLRTMGRHFRSSSVWFWGAIVWATLVAVFVLVGSTDAAFVVSLPNLPIVFLVVLVGFMAVIVWQRRAFRSTYLRALQSAGPGPLVDAVAAVLRRARVLEDIDVFQAQSKALAYSLYGCQAEATSALTAIDWPSKAPMIQSLGLSGEALIEVLCRRNARRGLALARQAQEKAAVAKALPGAAQTARYHAVCAGLSQALLGDVSPDNLRALEEAAATQRYPQLTLLASFGLAATMDRTGNAERARRLRAFIVRTAPHCAPLHLRPSDFQAAADASQPSDPGPVTASLANTAATVWSANQVNRTRPLRIVGIILGIWLALIVLFVVVWQMLSHGPQERGSRSSASALTLAGTTFSADSGSGS